MKQKLVGKNSTDPSAIDRELAENSNKNTYPATEKDKFSKVVAVYRLIEDAKIEIADRPIDDKDPSKGTKKVVEITSSPKITTELPIIEEANQVTQIKLVNRIYGSPELKHG
ncbi:14862_t:CDS:1 [Gigaspora rosea]|nr:14862_t:CDS:1 [Gigaspora rosea]